MKINVVEESITTALLELMQTKDYQKISITDIVKKAGVSRVSYYRHFTTKEDVLIRYFEIVKERFTNDNIEELTTRNWTEVIYAVFETFRKEKDMVLALMRAALENLYLDYISEQFENHYPVRVVNKYYLSFLAGACFNVGVRWIKNDFKDSIDDVCEPFVQIQNMFIQSRMI